MSLPKDKAWFSAKRYGWGWGLPMKWPGWVTMVLYLVAMTVGAIWLPTVHIWLFIGLCVIASGVLITICWWKGEPTKWRWGDEDK